MGQLEVNDGKYFVDGRELHAGMPIKRYDEVAKEWFEGKVGVVSSYNFDLKQYVSYLHLVVLGYAPSPLVAGDNVEVGEETQVMGIEQAMVEQAMLDRVLAAAENRARAEWEDNRTSFESLEAELVKTTPRSGPEGGEYYRVKVSALISDNFDHDMGSEEMELTIHFDQLGKPVFSNVEATRFREED